MSAQQSALFFERRNTRPHTNLIDVLGVTLVMSEEIPPVVNYIIKSIRKIGVGVKLKLVRG